MLAGASNLLCMGGMHVSPDFGIASRWAAELVQAALFEGATAVDATLGNGHDALRLCSLVGESGRVYGFDVQADAIERTRRRLDEAGVLPRARLFCAGHERMAEFVPPGVDAVVFNLGWLPGSAHAVTTRAQTTLAAARQALELLAPGALMTICVYPGHEEGARERSALLAWAAALPDGFDVINKRYLNCPKCPPELIAVRKKR